MKFDILNRFSGAIQVSVEIDCSSNAMLSVKLGLAGKVAIKNGADLSRADLSGADLSGADLSRVDLSGAYLSGADLSRADLSGADLSRADLSRADLSRAYLSGANLSRVDLSGAKDATLAIAMTRILPEGQLIGWKKLKGGIIAQLSIPANARRSHAFGRKCRAEFVDVIEGEGVSAYDGKTKYAPGMRVTAHKWCDDFTQECAAGIHFFITRSEAEAWSV